MLSPKAIEEFKEIFFETKGIRLTDADANARGLELLNFFKLIYKEIPKKSKKT